MKKVLSIVIVLNLLLVNCFGGYPVMDYTSYTYYAKQIKVFNDQVKTSLEQLETLNKANDMLNKANDLIFNTGEKIYNPAKQINGLINNITGIQNKFEKLTERVSNVGAERFFKEYHNVKEPLKDDVLAKWKANFNALFNNSEDETYHKLNDKILSAIKNNNYEAYQKAVKDLNEYLKLKGIEQETLKKYALLAPVELYNDYFINEESVKERKDKIDRIKQLAKQIESEKDVVKQQQTTNQFLLEMLDVQQAQYEMQMKFFYAISLNLINEKSNSKYQLQEVIEERENYRDSSDNKSIVTQERKELDAYFKQMEERGGNSEYYKRTTNPPKRFY
jgi:hypothetical protein